MKLQPPADVRLDYLDAVRSFALILGVIFHASLSFLPIFIGWAVMDISTSDVVSIFITINHSFRMELFFLIAGFFSHISFHKQGTKHFLQSKVVRVAVPFVIGWFLLRPLLSSGWIMGGESLRGDVDILNGLLEGFASLGTLPNGLFLGTHLWFLYYLLIIFVSVTFLRAILSVNKPLYSLLTQWGDSATRWICHSKLGIFVVAIPTVSCLWFMNNWGVDTPDKSLVPVVPVTILYTGFFLFGWILHRHNALIEKFAELTWHKLVIGVIAMITTVMLSSFEMMHGHLYYSWLKGGFLLSYAIMMWSFVAVTIGLCKRLFTRSNRFVRYMADTSYWLYLIHLPIVVWLQIAFAELSLHWLVKLSSISAITIIISIILYDAFVRSTFIGAVLNGKRKPRSLFSFYCATKHGV